MPGADYPSSGQVTYHQQYRRCGKAACSRCATGGPGHGPYWYAFWSERGRSHSRYLGKQLPADVAAATALVLGSPVPTASVSPLPPLRVQTLGSLAVWRGEVNLQAAAWTNRRATALFMCLLSTPGHRLHREQASELLWPETDPTVGAHRLRTVVHWLRQVLDDPRASASYLRSEGGVLALAPGGDAPPDAEWLDAMAFAAAARAALASRDTATCRAALARYSGDYLPDEPYADWATAAREALRQQYVNLLLHLASLSGAQGGLEEAEGCLRRVLSVEPGHEGAAATLMGVLTESGRRDEALRVYQALATVLQEELDVTPGAEVTALRARLVAPVVVPLAVRLPADPTAAARLSNIPVALTSFVGREWEVSEVTGALGHARLVTLTGPGGCGKTRLALEVAVRLVDAYRDGVWLVELAALADPALVSHAVRTVLGLTERPSHSVHDTLVAFLQPRHLLLVLDNCEHLIGACAEVAGALLGACPHLSLLATSREALAVAGERPYLVPPLAVPDPLDLPSLERLGAYEAVQLFVERAQARCPEWTLTAAHAGAVAQICARLDGLPLAIELAAVRVSALPVAGIAARLDDRFRLLTGGPRTALPRQQTLRATLDWSYRLLAPAEQALFARLAIFVGGCTLAAVQAVCGTLPDAEYSVLEGVTELARKGLLTTVDGTGGEPRFGMLETIRAYALQALEDSDLAETARQCHAAYFLELAEEAERQQWGPQQRVWLERVEEDHDNIRAALRWLLDQADAKPRLRLAFAMWRFWMLHSHLHEGSRWLEEVLARDDAAPLLRAKVLYGAGVLAYRQCDYAQARALHEAGLSLFRAIGDAWGIARSLNQLGNVTLDADGDGAQATALYRESLRLARELGDTWLSATCLGNLGLVALKAGDYAEARALHEENLALSRRYGDNWQSASNLTALARIALEQGDARHAIVLLGESIGLLRDLGDMRALADALEVMAAATGLQGQPQRAARLWGAAERLRSEAGAPLETSERARNDRWLATIRGQVRTEAVWRAKWNAGRLMTLEQAITLAVMEDAAQPPTSSEIMGWH